MNASTPTAPVSPAKVATAPVAQLLALDQINPDPNQPRKSFDPVALQDLANSIKADGLVQPMVVRPNGKGFYLVAGERRLRACKLAGLKEAPVIVRADLKDQDVAVLQLVENVQREDLTPFELCEAVTKLVNKVGFKTAVEQLGRSEAWVSKRVNALKAPEPITALLKSGAIADLEVVNDLHQIHKLDPEEAKAYIAQAARFAKEGKPANRTDSRDWLEDAERNARWEKERAEREARDKALAERHAKQVKAGTVTPQQVKQRQEDRVKDSRKLLRTGAIASMYASLGLKPSLADSYEAPIALEYGHDFNNYSGKASPTSAGACHFAFKGRGDVALLNRIAAGFAKQPKISVNVPDLTLEQAGRLEKALKDVKGIELAFEVEVTGNQLADIVKRLAPAKKLPPQISTLLAPPAAPKKVANKKR